MRIIFDGQECLQEYKRLLSAAKRTIWISMYMIRFDDCSNEIWDILEQKHAQGVKVRVWYDLFGSFRSLMRLSRSPFCKAFVPRWHRLGRRNHTKVFLVDGTTAVVSGRNFTERYYGDWVDASVFIEEKDLLEEVKGFIDRIEDGGRKRPDGTGKLKLTDPLVGQRSVYNFVLEHIVKSKREIMIASPYFVIDDALESLLLAAADRGVQVTVIVPKKPEHKLAATFNRINFQRIHHKNVTVKRSSGMFHSKVMLFDDTALVGSANFDNRSFKHNVEASVVMDKKHIGAIKEHLHEVADHSVRYNWIQRAYDQVLLQLTKPFMELL